MARAKVKIRKAGKPDIELPSDGKIEGSGYGKGFGNKKTPTTKTTKGPKASYGDPFTGS